MPAQPQDRKPAKGDLFKFTGADGKKYTLPPVAIGRKTLTGRDLRDAAMNGELGQIGYMLKMLEAAGADPKAIDAVYDMPQDDMLEVLKGWGEHGDGDGVSLGESSA